MPDRPRRASALRYEGDGAPKLVASGRNLIADRIIEEAEKAGVPVRRDAALAEALAGLEIGQEISDELYSAVAEALAWAYKLSTTQPR